MTEQRDAITKKLNNSCFCNIHQVLFYEQGKFKFQKFFYLNVVTIMLSHNANRFLRRMKNYKVGTVLKIYYIKVVR